MQGLLEQLQQRRMLHSGVPLQVVDLPTQHGGHRRHLSVLENGRPKFFVKVAEVEEDASSLKKEFDALVLVRRLHRDSPLINNLPNPLYFSRVDGQWALVMASLPGKTEELAFYPGGFGFRRRLKGIAFLKVMPEVLTRLHHPLRISGRPQEIVCPHGLSEKAQTLVFKSLERLDRNAGPTGGTHGDFGPGNILRTHDMAWFLDWEDYQKNGFQVFDLFSLFTTSARGQHRIPKKEGGPTPKDLAQAPANQVAYWLFRKCGYQSLFFSALQAYGKATGFNEGWLASAYPAYLAAKFWQDAAKEGPEGVKALEWQFLLEHLAASRLSPLNHF